jgi:multimeric flavodoxin WrbA
VLLRIVRKERRILCVLNLNTNDKEDQMKVLGICCGRKNGNTEIMMKEAFMTIEEKIGAECQLVRIQEAEIRHCVGCETCMVNHLKGNWDFRCIHKYWF